MTDQWKAFSFIFSWATVTDLHHCESDTPGAELEPAHNLSSGFVEWTCAVVITTTPQYLKVQDQIGPHPKSNSKSNLQVAIWNWTLS